MPGIEEASEAFTLSLCVPSSFPQRAMNYALLLEAFWIRAFFSFTGNGERRIFFGFEREKMETNVAIFSFLPFFCLCLFFCALCECVCVFSTFGPSVCSQRSLCELHFLPAALACKLRGSELIYVLCCCIHLIWFSRDFVD